MTGVVVLLAALVVAVVVAGLYRWRNGRFHAGSQSTVADGAGPVSLDPSRLEAEFGERATLVQFSSAFCSPCRATRSVLEEVARITPGVVHVEVDAESHLELVRDLGILRTPTVLVLDARGVERRRASGLPTREQALSAVASTL